MQNTFSRSFKLEEGTEKKFYFKPNKSGAELLYLVHTNRDPELKKFRILKIDGAWKVEPQVQKLPEWLFTLEQQFDASIKEAIASQPQ